MEGCVDFSNFFPAKSYPKETKKTSEEFSMQKMFVQFGTQEIGFSAIIAVALCA